MRILHTADWHLGNRIGGLSRREDQLGQIERILALCDEREVDVLVVAGDVFDAAEADQVRDLLGELSERLRSRITRSSHGLSVLMIPGNHDRASIFPLLESAQFLGGKAERGAGRALFRANPSVVPRTDRHGVTVQFLLLPFPRPSVFLDGSGPVAGGPEMRAALAESWRNDVRRLQAAASQHSDQPVVLVSHILVRGADLGSGYHLSEDEDVPVDQGDIPAFAYVALGHVHKPGRVGGRAEVQYPGALERLALDEAAQQRGVIIFDVGTTGLVGEPEFVELPACAFARLEVRGQEGMVGLVDRVGDPTRTYVEVSLVYTPGQDNAIAMRQEIQRTFPRCFRILLRPQGGVIATTNVQERVNDVRGTVRDYVSGSITDPEQLARVLRLLDEICAEVPV